MFIGFMFLCVSTFANPTDTMQQVKTLVKDKKFQQAILLCEPFAKHNTTDTIANELCGDICSELSLFEYAEKYYSTTLLYVKNKQNVTRKRAIILYLTKQFKLAKPDWEKVCSNNPLQKQSWYYLGLVEAKLGNTKAALQNMDKALSIDPQYIEALIARAEFQLILHNYAQALSNIDTALKVLQYTDELFLSRGYALLGLKKYNESQKMFERVISRNNQNLHAWFGLGNAFFNAKNYPKAIEAFSQSITLKNTFELAYFKRGMAYLELKQTDNACNDLLKSSSFGYAEAIYYVQKYCDKK